MFYKRLATKNAPALIIYLLDMSESMREKVGGQSKVDLITQTLMHVVREMVRRSTKGTTPSPRYELAVYAYHEKVRDVLGGPRLITDVIRIGIPQMSPSGVTDTAGAFEEAERLLRSRRDRMGNHPTPLICHFTDGGYTTVDPLPVVQRIRDLEFPDGPVLVENVFFDAKALPNRVDDPYRWKGISERDELATEDAKRLFDMSSPIPDSYLRLFAARGYTLERGARLLFPGDTPEMVEAGFTMSGMTPVV